MASSAKPPLPKRPSLGSAQKTRSSGPSEGPALDPFIEKLNGALYGKIQSHSTSSVSTSGPHPGLRSANSGAPTAVFATDSTSAIPSGPGPGPDSHFPLKIRILLSESVLLLVLLLLRFSLTSSDISVVDRPSLPITPAPSLPSSLALAKVEISCTSKPTTDKLVAEMLESGYALSFDYAGFISHPGNLFVKNLQTALVTADGLRDFFNSRSRYASICDVNVFANNADPAESFAIVKFANYLDVEDLLQTPELANPFHEANVPLYLNKYISKKQRKLRQDDESTLYPAPPDTAPSPPPTAGQISSHTYETVVVENLDEFLNPLNPSLALLYEFFAKFEIFNRIESVYFPLESSPNDASLVLKNFGYINFELSPDLNVNVLKCLYYLNNLTFTEFINFSAEDLYDITTDLNVPDRDEPDTIEPRLKVSISQHRHNHYLFHFNPAQPQQFVYNLPRYGCSESLHLTVGFLDVTLHDLIVNKFSKVLNFQETNIYVNNFPVVFENNDALWEQFWSQFGVGKVKSAKIIKPQFYSKLNNGTKQKSSEALGKIGFVFYESLKMALRAILLTNDRVVNIGGDPNASVVIQTSFAIQKSHNSGSKHSNAGANHLYLHRSLLPFSYHPNGYMKRFSLPILRDSSLSPNTYSPPACSSPPPSVLPPPEYVYFNPYMFAYNYPMMSPPVTGALEDVLEDVVRALPPPPPPIISPYFYHQSYYPFLPPQSVPVHAVVPPEQYFSNSFAAQPGAEHHKPPAKKNSLKSKK